MNSLTFNVISDTHFYSKEVGIVGPEFEKANNKSPMDLKNSEEICDALADQLIADETKIILLSGDVTSNGEPESHQAALRFLNKLKSAGKAVYVITATHDYQDSGFANRFTPEGKEPLPTLPREEMIKLYHDFGYNQAITVHEESQSYICRLEDGFLLFAINDDHNDDGWSGISTPCMKWIEENVKKAKENGDAIIMMTHHPMVSPSPFYSIIGAGDMMHEHVELRDKFADMGVNFVFTGHTHMQDISYAYSENGNIFYDITTAAPVGYPGTFRKAILNKEDNTLDVNSIKLNIVPDCELQGGNIEEHLQEKFFGMIKNILIAAGKDLPTFARMADAISIRPYVSYRFGWIIKPIGKILNKLKVKHVAAICKKETGLKKSDYADVADMKVLDLIMEFVTNLYGGDGKYSPDTAVYKITMGACGIIDSIMNVLGIKLSKILKGSTCVADLVKPLLFNDGICDEKAVLNLDPKTKIEVKQYNDTVKKSKKGLPLLILIVLLVIILLPVEILYFGSSFLINKIKYGKLMKK